MRVLVTGASGFIGSAFIRDAIITQPDMQLTALCRATDSKNQRRLNVPLVEKVHIKYGDLNWDISGLCEGQDAVVNFAAKTFVDHSIRDPRPFVEANVFGTLNLLEDARKHKVKRFIQVSTDEVYGSILDGSYTENSRLNPTNPYAASKAGADALAISYAHTFGMHTTVTRTENNYGPYQNPQKVFPAFVKCVLDSKKLPIYGDGRHVRQWLWVLDHVRAIYLLLQSEYPAGEVFHVAGNQELTNIDLAKAIIGVCDTWAPQLFARKFGTFDERIEFINDTDIRPGHDKRYALSCEKIQKLGWKPEMNLRRGITEAVRWYLDNPGWLS